MKTIFEYLKTNIKSSSNQEKSEYDSNTWEVGDIICGTSGATMCLPIWFKIIKRTTKKFTCFRLKGKIISGGSPGQWEELPTEYKYSDTIYTGMMNKNGYLRIDDTLMHLWDGKTPLSGDDMD